MGYRYNPFTGELDRVDTTNVPPSFADTFVADTGTATPASFILNLLGDASQGLITSAAGNTVTFTNDNATETQKGVIETSTDPESIAGISSIVAVVPTSLKAKLGSQTQFGSPYGDTDTNAIQWTSAGTNGQLLIAATGAAPAFASLTSTGGTVTYTAGPNSLNLEASGSVAIDFITDSGTAIPVANKIDIVGNSAQGVSTSGATNVVTITVADSSTSQKGVLETSTDAESIAGTSTTVAVTPESLKAKLGSQTSDGIPYGVGDTSAVGWTSGLTDGQLVIGSTAGVPAAASLASADSSITITPGSNTIDLATGTAVATSFTTDSGTATPSSGVLNIAGGTLLNTAGATNAVTINADDNVVGSVISDSGTATPASNAFTITGSGGITTSATGSTVTITGSGGITWSVETGTTGSLTANTGNIGNNAAGVTFTLPATCTVGDIIRVTGLQASWTIAQNASQTIHFGNQSTTAGVGGSLASTNARDAVEMVCVVTDTDFQILSSVGNITVT